MTERDYLAERFEENRAHLRAVAYRMLGSLSDVDDAVQEAWLRLSRVDATSIDNLGGQAKSWKADWQFRRRHE
jgi:RNA polymerase sigma-70 factor, ECF subfamily